MSLAAAPGAVPEKVQRSRMFRRSPTPAEAALWEGLRRKFVAHLRFRRQHVVAGYIVDFYCPALKLAIEVDGEVHDTQRERDEQRTLHLTRLGIKVLRFPNTQVLETPTTVLETILKLCKNPEQ